MKVKVIESFIDIHTGENHPVGEVMEITTERYAEIMAYPKRKFIEIIREEKKAGNK